jgi:hypothetical protein
MTRQRPRCEWLAAELHLSSLPCSPSCAIPNLHRILALLASVTRQELAHNVAYLMEENRIPRAMLQE